MLATADVPTVIVHAEGIPDLVVVLLKDGEVLGMTVSEAEAVLKKEETVDVTLHTIEKADLGVLMLDDRAHLAQGVESALDENRLLQDEVILPKEKTTTTKGQHLVHHLQAANLNQVQPTAESLKSDWIVTLGSNATEEIL